MLMLGSAGGKARSEAFRHECVEFLAHYSLSKAHSGCTVTYDKDTATISVCETTTSGAASVVDESDRTNVNFSNTGLNEWYRALNRAGYRTFMAGHELVLTVTKGGKEEEVWYYLTPPLQHGSSSQESSSEPQSTSTGAITFMGHNTSCTFQIVVSYNEASE